MMTVIVYNFGINKIVITLYFMKYFKYPSFLAVDKWHTTL